MVLPDRLVLDGLTILVTRPEYQQQILSGLIEQEGGTPYCFPTLEIVPLDNTQQLIDTLGRLGEYDIAVFVSPNAATYVFDTLRSSDLSMPGSLLLACVGKGCTKTVEDHGFQVAITPASGIGSEGLLAHDVLKSVQNKRIVIFRGNGGRELLAEELTRRGAKVDYCECYQRRIPRTDPAPLTDELENGHIDVVTITSTQALKNLWVMLGDKAAAFLTSLPVVVISERIGDTASNMGFGHVLVTKDTSDQAIVDTIKQWRQTGISL